MEHLGGAVGVEEVPAGENSTFCEVAGSMELSGKLGCAWSAECGGR